MNRHRFAWVAALIVLLLGSSGAPGSAHVVMAQGPSLDPVTKAVVRISGQRCQPVCREAGVGSGAIVHPSGVILTAYHALLDPEKSNDQFLDQYVIEMTEDVRRPAIPRYRARIIAVQPALDFALLRIDRTADDSRTFAPFELTGLPVLSLGSAAELRQQEQLLIAGYPFLGGRSIKVDNKNLTGFDSERLSGQEVSDAFLTVQGRLSEGYSGGPVLVQRSGEYRIVGTVLKGVGIGQEIGYLRSIDLLRDLRWLEPQARANAQRVDLELGQSASGEPELRISLSLQALDLVGRRASLVFYAYADDVLGMPVYASSGPNRTRVGQVAFAADVAAQKFLDRIEASQLRIPVGAPSIAAGPIKLRVLLWDTEVLWQSNEWYRPQPVSKEEVTPVPSPLRTHPPAPSATVAPTQTPTVKSLLTDTPTPALTPSPSWTLTPTRMTRPTTVPSPAARVTTEADSTSGSSGNLSGQIVFLSNRDYPPEEISPMNPDLGPLDIYAMNPDGSNQRRITTGLKLSNTSRPIVSPDGTQIFRGGYDDKLQFLNADGSTHKTIGSPGAGAALDWVLYRQDTLLGGGEGEPLLARCRFWDVCAAH